MKMDEETYFNKLDEKFTAVGNILDELSDKLDLVIINLKVKEIVEEQKNLADFSEEPKAKSRYAKKMGERLGGWKISPKGCNKCNGKITWDNYDKADHPYPDHVDENGNLLANCPAYNPREV